MSGVDRPDSLRPGPGQDPESVAEDQRRRLLAAMTDLVYEAGYTSITVRELVARAHVTKPTFYRLFTGKEDCFARAYEEAATGAFRALDAATSPAGAREDIVRRALETFVEMVVRYPGGAYLGLLETLTAGPSATEWMRRTEDEVVGLAIRRFAEADDPVAVPSEVAQAIVSGVGRLARERLKERPDAFRADADELRRWIVSVTDSAVEGLSDLHVDSPGTRSRPRFRGDLRLPMSEERELLIGAVIRLAAEEGFEPLSPKRIAAAAGLPRRTFDSEFGSVEECLSRALEVGTTVIVVDIQGAFEAAPDWAHGIRRALEALCGFFVSEPGMARLAFVELFVPGRAVTQRGSGMLSALARLLRDRTPLDLRPGPVEAEAAVGAIWTLLRRRTAAGRISELPFLAPTLAWLVLAPAIGGDEALRVLDDARP
jgi:AcrR family transcriptional regulator